MNDARTIALLAAAGMLAAWRAGAQDTQAQQGQTTTTTEQQGASQQGSQQGEKTVNGQITSVSSDALTIQTDKGPMTLRVNDSTQVAVAGRQKTAGDLKEGAQVRAAYEERAGERTATRIDAIDTGEPSSGSGAAAGSSGASGPSDSTGASGSTGPSGPAPGTSQGTDRSK